MPKIGQIIYSSKINTAVPANSFFFNSVTSSLYSLGNFDPYVVIEKTEE